MMNHFDRHNILVDCQHGFRAKRSCETQLISLTQELHQHLESKEQVDMIVLDFSKAFDKVPHQRLIRKLENYGIRGKTLDWINSFLSNRKRVVVDGEMSDWVPVQSGVPQGTVLGPILFLAFINDLPKCVESRVRLFADDCVLYRAVSSEADCNALQDDLARLENWEQQWCMNFNASKCNAISITRKHKKLSHNYSLHNEILDRVNSATYLGVELASDLTWATHINKTSLKANRQLGFVKRNIPIKNVKVKEAAYKGLVRPILEYSASVWDPHHKKYIAQLEMIQRRAARFTLGRYNNTSSVTDMLKQLEWDKLEQRRAKARLTMFYKIQHSLVAIIMPPFIVHPTRQRPGHPHQYVTLYCRTEAYKNSFYPRTLAQWNSIPSSIALKPSLSLFKAGLSSISI